MIYTLVISLIIIACAMVLLGIRILFVKGGKFPDLHIDGNKALRKKGIHCARAQDLEARKAGRNM
ncbi:MAG: hypothetical protein PHI48_08490 [Bacteroidales bacterium]|nr:hypothetical protein [Bacteroidales bacterium]